ncbi:MAG: hypothetical protein CMJ50_02385 [Planctomycetaceae bacterium]|nr:hypothetical protein [Planctomycetaceae bacterium]
MRARIHWGRIANSVDRCLAGGGSLNELGRSFVLRHDRRNGQRICDEFLDFNRLRPQNVRTLVTGQAFEA